MGIERYAKEIMAQPLICPQDEQHLWECSQRGEALARQTIMKAYARIVLKRARQWARRGVSGMTLDDFIQVGNEGCLHAIAAFDPSRGVAFATYADRWIRAYMWDAALRTFVFRYGTHAKPKRIYTRAEKVMRSLGVRQDRYGMLAPDDVSIVADALRVSADELMLILSQRRANVMKSLDVPRFEDGAPLRDQIADDSPDPELCCIENDLQERRRAAIFAAISTLPPREKEIFIGRRLTDPPVKLDVFARALGITHQRVQQLEKAAFFKVERLLVRQRAALS